MTASTTGTVVTTTRGAVRGTVENGIHVFRGVPYAEPPVGPLRFRPPRPRARWDGVRDATRFGESHLQDHEPVEARLMAASARPPSGDDCLNLNVWTPDPGATGLPVLVWIHGGSLKYGTGGDELYDGATFARAGVVCVTLNYRLHPAGFLRVGDRPGSGAFGLLDQIAALEWVHDNIAGFGGDPSRVTIAGESAGGHSVGQLLAAPRARGLFRRAIAQSGAASYELPVEQAEVIGRAVLSRLGIDRPDDDAFAAIDGAALLAASRAVEREMSGLLDAAGMDPTLMGVTTRSASLPTYGGDVLPVRALDAVAAGAARGIDLLLGTTLDETTLFPPAFGEAAPAVAEAAFGPTGPAALAAYRRGSPGGTEQEGRMSLLTDTLFRIPAIRLAEAAQRHAKVHMYLLTWASPPTGRALGAFHALDLPFMWNRIDAVAAPFFELAGRPPDPALAEAMHGAWAEFVTTGTPRHHYLPQWPGYDPTRRSTMLLDTQSRVVDDPLGEQRRLWDRVRF
jgi:carboxylesterase type B